MTFLRAVGLLLVGALLFLGLRNGTDLNSLLSSQSSLHDELVSVEQSRMPEFDIYEDVNVDAASPEFTPEDVVRVQVEALRESVDNPEAIRTCYSLAAPSNRAVTGPLERFFEIVHSEDYRPLIESSSWQVGAAAIDESLATVNVTALGQDDRLLAFRFLLQRQSETPYESCWMTVAVEVVPLSKEQHKFQSVVEEQIDS